MYLITGAGGGVGSVSRSAVESLLDDGERVRAMVHAMTNGHNSFGRWEPMSSSVTSPVPRMSWTRWPVSVGCSST